MDDNIRNEEGFIVDPVFSYSIDKGPFLFTTEVFIYDGANNIRLEICTPSCKRDCFTVDMSVIESIERVLDKYMDLIELGADLSDHVENQDVSDFVDEYFDDDSEEDFDLEDYDKISGSKHWKFLFNYKGELRSFYFEDLNKFVDKKVLYSEGNPPVIQWRLIELLDEIRAILIPQGIDPKFLSL